VQQISAATSVYPHSPTRNLTVPVRTVITSRVTNSALTEKHAL